MTKKLLDRAEVLEGMAGRLAKQASTLLVLIESRTAYLAAQSQQAMNQFLTETALAERNRAYLEAIALGREPPVPPTIQELERYAPQWSSLVPENPNVRAAVAYWLKQKYQFTYSVTPRLRAALSLDLPTVQTAYQRLYNQPLASIFAQKITLTDRVRWTWTSLGIWLENLSPFWTAFALVLTETVGAGILALPIALAQVGPLVGLAILLLLGLVNIATIAAITEAMARNGQVRYGHVYFGGLVADYLGNAGSLILTLALLLLFALIIIAYYIGFGLALADATVSLGHPPAALWAGLLFLTGLYFSSRKNLNSTVTSALIIGAINIALILLLSGLALLHLQPANLAYVNFPLFNGRPFDGSILELIFGVVLLSYFGHTSTGNCARVVLRRDPSARSLIWGSMAATIAAMGLYGFWVLAVNGAIAPAALAQETGTALTPLAARVGPSVHLFGAIFATLSMGLASIHMSLGLFYLVQERLQRRTHNLGERERFWLAMSPLVLLFLLTEWLLITGRESFTKPLSFTGMIIVTLVGGIFPVLLLVASRRKGELVPGLVLPVLGHPLVVMLLYLLFLTSLLLHGLVIWHNPLERAVAVLVSVLVVGATIVMVRRGSFRSRLVVEVRQEQSQGGQASFALTAHGQPAPASIQLDYGHAEQPMTDHRSVSAGTIPNFSALARFTVDIPVLPMHELKVWVHRITPEGESEGLPVTLQIKPTNDTKREGQPLINGQAILALSGAEREATIRFAESTSLERMKI